MGVLAAMSDHEDEDDGLDPAIEDAEEDEMADAADEMPELTTDQLKLLYMISRYSHCSTSADEKEEWIRKVPLLCLIYEGITHNSFDYDYAPASELINQRRVYFNMSQEGKSDVDCLREFDLMNALKLSSKEHTSVTAYQISLKGLKIIQFLSEEDKADVDQFIYAPGASGDVSDPDPDDLLKVHWNG